MPVATFPFTEQPNQRGVAGSSKDSVYECVLFSDYKNPLTGEASVYAEKRDGLFAANTPASGRVGTSVLRMVDTFTLFSAFTTVSSSEIYDGTPTSQGVITGTAVHMTEVSLDDTSYCMITSSDGTGWFIADDATSGFTFTGNFTLGSTTVTSVSSFTGLYVGQGLSTTGAQVQSGSRIQSLDSGSNQLVMTIAAGASGTGTTVTRTGVAKIIDSDFPTNCRGQFVEQDGYVLIMTATGRVYQSDLNSVTSWGSSNFLTCSYVTAEGVTLARTGTFVAAFTSLSLQFLFNNGNENGTVFSINQSLNQKIGCRKNNDNRAAIASVDNYVVFYGSNQGSLSAGNAIYALNGVIPVPISSQSVEAEIAGTSNVYVSAFRYFGKNLVFIGSETDDVDFFGDIDKRTWTRGGFPNKNIIFSADDVGISAVDGSTEGKLFNLGTNNYTDNLSTYTVLIQTQPFYLNDGQPFTIHEVELIGDTQSSGNTTLSSCDDDYTTFTVRGAFDMTKQRKVVNRCGHYKSHVIFKLEHSANTAWRAQALKIHWSPAVGRGFR